MVDRKKKDYTQGKIYYVRSYKTDLIYIGSTCQPLYKRLNEHKTNYKTWLKTGISKYTSSKIYELDDSPYIELLVNYPCHCLDELRREEGKFIRSMECVNKRVEGRTQKEWRDDNKDLIKEKDKKYREDNKDRLKEYQKKYKKQNKDKINQKFICPCGSNYTKTNKSHHDKTKKHKQFINLL